MPRLLVEKGPDRGKAVATTAGQQIVIGRDPGASLQLTDQLSSRRHCMVVGKGAVWGLKDLGSVNGTLINGRRMNNAQRLEFGDTIQIGETLISWLPDEQTEKKGGLIGKEIGGYRIEQRIGRGAMGTVFKATQLSLGRTVALKVLSPELTKDPKFCDMFLKEARAAGALNNSNIIQVYDVGDEDGQYYFSMEYAAKGSVLEEMSSQKALPLARTIKVVKDACAALDYAERKGLVHRDIKPDNLMVTEDGTVKLGDLGLAMSAHEVNAEQDGVFGTPHYIAPEQAMGRPIDHRADIYALGASFYRMVTGRTMFEGATVKEILKQQVRDPHPPVSTHVPDCPPGISTIIDRMLMKNPAERYQHASEVSADLANFELMAVRKPQGTGSAFAARPKGLTHAESQQIAGALRTRNLVLAVIAAAVAIVGLLAVLWLFVLNGGGANPIAENTPAVNAANAPVEVSDAVRRANEELTKAVGLAEGRFRDRPDREGCEKALAGLEEALKAWPGASPEVLDKATTLRGRIRAELLKATRGGSAAREEWETVRRTATGLAEEFKFRAGMDTIKAFVDKHGDQPDSDIQQVVKDATGYLAGEGQGGGYLGECQGILKAFESEIERERKRVEGLADAQRIPGLRGALSRVRIRRDQCDEAVYQGRLDTLAKALEKEVESIENAGKAQLVAAQREAAARCARNLVTLLGLVSQQVAQGRFASAAKLVEDFEARDPDYMAFAGIELFEPIRADIKRRKDQTALIVASLEALKAALPTADGQRAMLRQKPWPKDVEDLLGGAGVTIGLTLNPAKSEGAWALDCYGAQARSINATEFETPQRRKALAAALAHLLANDAGMGAGVMRAPRQTGVPAAVGVFAWLAEMEAYTEAFAFIDKAWRENEIDTATPVIKEYYAWGILGRMEVASRTGNVEEYEKLKTDLEQFKDTRAYMGRK